MDSPSASVRIKFEKGEIEICGSEEFVSDHLDQLQKFLPSPSETPEETSLSRRTNRSQQSPRKSDSEYGAPPRNRHPLPEDKATNTSSDRSEQQSGFEIPETPQAVFEMWRSRIHNGYISKYLLTAALGYFKQTENEQRSFTVSEVRDLYRTIGTTANVHSDLRKAREKHLIRTVSKEDETPSHQVTPLGEAKLRESFAE